MGDPSSLAAGSMSRRDEVWSSLGDTKSPVTHKVLSVSANLAQLLPTGSVLAFQLLAPSFNNQGKCHTANWWLTFGLVVVLTASCVFFAFTDSLAHDGKTYFGVAMRKRLKLLGVSEEDRAELGLDEAFGKQLRRRRLKGLDLVHAFLAAAVFLTMAFGDVGLQNCFWPSAGTNTQQLLKNLPLGMSIFASLIFTVFPTTRRTLGCHDPAGEGGSSSSSGRGSVFASKKEGSVAPKDRSGSADADPVDVESQAHKS